VTRTASCEPAFHRYRSGPVDVSLGRAENATHCPSPEYATSPTTVTPDAITTAPGGVVAGEGVGVAGSGLEGSPVGGPPVGGGGVAGAGVEPGEGTGTTRIRESPGWLASPGDSTTRWLSDGDIVTVDGIVPRLTGRACPLSRNGRHSGSDRGHTAGTSVRTSSHEPSDAVRIQPTGLASGRAMGVGATGLTTATDEAPGL
jgi:hypothetical protein